MMYFVLKIDINMRPQSASSVFRLPYLYILLRHPILPRNLNLRRVPTPTTPTIPTPIPIPIINTPRRHRNAIIPRIRIEPLHNPLLVAIIVLARQRRHAHRHPDAVLLLLPLQARQLVAAARPAIVVVPFCAFLGRAAYCCCAPDCAGD